MQSATVQPLILSSRSSRSSLPRPHLLSKLSFFFFKLLQQREEGNEKKKKPAFVLLLLPLILDGRLLALVSSTPFPRRMLLSLIRTKKDYFGRIKIIQKEKKQKKQQHSVDDNAWKSLFTPARGGEGGGRRKLPLHAGVWGIKPSLV